MAMTGYGSELDRRVREFVREGFTPHFGELRARSTSSPTWARLRSLGTELWLDTGDVDAIEQMWTREFTALTTNNTLLNREVQKGTYDGFIPRAAELLDQFPGLSQQQRRLELAFILNARHGLKLVELFDAFVSVEEHTDLTHDEEAAVQYARRYHAVCPERFYVKVPFSAAGLLATRRLSDEGIPINHTLGFSARQNYLIARLGRPAFVNVFMGRLNSFVADNGLGEGSLVGERATLASQRSVRELRREAGVTTRQIGASLREGGQVRDLAGMDVMTMPPKAAQGFLELDLPPDEIVDRTGRDYRPPLAGGVDPRQVGLHTLWEVGDELKACVEQLEAGPLDELDADGLVEFFHRNGCGDVLVPWSDQQIATSAAEGKIPDLDNWADDLAGGRIGLDSLMNLAGWNSFRADQEAMDHRVLEVVS